MRRRAGLLLAAVAVSVGIALGLLFTGGTQPKARARPSWQVIRWTDAVVKPTRYVPPVPGGAPPCTGKRVRFRYAGAAGVNSTQVILWLRVRNIGKATCALEGRPASP
jgi:hypothetical protein